MEKIEKNRHTVWLPEDIWQEVESAYKEDNCANRNDVSTLLHSGIDKQTVAELAGHADTGFLERTYCHPEMARKRDAAASMLTSLHPGGGMLFPLQTAAGK